MKLHSAPREAEAGTAPHSLTVSLCSFLQIASVAEYNVHLLCWLKVIKLKEQPAHKAQTEMAASFIFGSFGSYNRQKS